MAITLDQPRDVRNAWIIWGSLIVLFLAIGFSSDFKRSVSREYYRAAENWTQGEDLYEDGIHGFLYLPTAAVAFIPFTWVSLTWGEAAWRVVTIGSYAYGVRRLAAVAGRATRTELFPLMTLMTIPLALDSARNGQMNLPLASTMMLTAAALADRRWWWATLWLGLGVGLKPLMIVMGLLVWVIHPPMRWRLPVALAALLAGPYATQNPSYVTGQYWGFYEKSLLAASPNTDEARWYSDVFGIARWMRIELPPMVQTLTRVIAAVVTLGITWWAHRRMAATRAALMLFVFSAGYLMLFNPRTENNSYAVVAPAIAMFGAWAFLVYRQRAVGWWLVVVMALMTLNHEICKHLTPGYTTWMRPLLTGAWMVYVIHWMWAERPKTLEDNASGLPG